MITRSVPFIFILLLSSFLLVVMVFLSPGSLADSKYSKDSNVKSLHQDKKPFRMQKINLLWQKAQTKLAPAKLKTLFKELKEQDKDEILLKKLRSDGGHDKGVKQIEVQRKFNLILTRYAIEDIFTQDQESSILIDEQAHSKRLFKDKKLDKLWQKAEQRHFSEQELKMLKEEFQEFEAKQDDYHLQMERAEDEQAKNEEKKETIENSIDPNLTNNNDDHLKRLNENHREMKRHFNELEDRVLRDVPRKSGHSSDHDHHQDHLFEEPRVINLWKLASKVGFDQQELTNLKEELQHFEGRLQKLAYLEEHFVQPIDNSVKKPLMMDKHLDVEEMKHMRKQVVDLNRHVDKLERDLEVKIMSKHIEL